MANLPIKLRTPRQQIAEDTLPGDVYSQAWIAIVDALNSTDPDWWRSRKGLAVDAVVDWIKSKGTK